MEENNQSESNYDIVTVVAKIAKNKSLQKLDNG